MQKAFKLDPIDEAEESIIGPLIEIQQYKLDKNGNLKRNKMRNESTKFTEKIFC